MSNTQGETAGRRRWIGMTVAAVVVAGAVGGIGVTLVNANAAAQAHTALMVEVKSDGKTLNAASAEDEALAASVVEAGQIDHIQELAAADTAAKVAAEQAAAAEAARVAAEQAAAQQAAAQQTAQRQAATNDAPAGPSKCPANTHPNAVDGNGNESNCEANGPGGAICQAYDANNNCTNWYKP